MLKGQASVIRKINSWNTSLPEDAETPDVNTCLLLGYQNVLLSQDIVLKSESTLSIPTMELKY